jgi:hypothetical protein
MSDAGEQGSGACCRGAPAGQAGGSGGTLSGWQRRARAWAGLGFLALAAALGALAAAFWFLLWLPAAVAAWFGLTHLVAAATGYVGCPELVLRARQSESIVVSKA